MKIRTKILILLMLGALVPLSISHIFVHQLGSQVFEQDARDALVSNAKQLSGRIDDRIGWMLESTSMVVRSVPFENFAPEDLPKALSIPYRQLSYANVVVLLDANGKAIISPYRPPLVDAQTTGRFYVTDDELQRFSQSVPMELALKASLALGPVYVSEAGEPRIVVASSFPVAKDRNWVLAVGVALNGVCDILRVFQEDTGVSAKIVDSRGYALCRETTAQNWQIQKDFERIANQKNEVVLSHVRDDVEYVDTVSEVPITGWRVVVEQRRDVALAELNRIFRLMLIWAVLSLLFAIAGGVILSKGLTSPLGDLLSASSRVAGGDYTKRIEISSRDEIGQLAESFNKMTGEIKSWNTELQSRVEEKTKALREAQEQIIKTQKLAAVGELGAGVAHEINNPLTGVIGNAQYLLSEAPEGSELSEVLSEIVHNSRRIADVVDSLLRYSQTRWAETSMPVDMGMILKDAASMFTGRFEEAGVDVVWSKDGDLRVNGVEGDLQLVCTHLLSNALTAMDKGGTLSLEVKAVDGGAIMMSVEDTGIGMDDNVRRRAMDPFFTTAPPGSGSKGVGLSTVHRIVVEHEGKIVVESEQHKGTKVIVYLAGSLKLSK